jgi:hypothetical protein
LGLHAWLETALPGDCIAYYRGFLAVDAAPGSQQLAERDRAELVRLAGRLRRLADEGAVHLVQSRNGTSDYTYILILRPRHRAGYSALAVALARFGVRGRRGSAATPSPHFAAEQRT